jgi:hypothetical protein
LIARLFRCFSSPNCNRYAGLQFGILEQFQSSDPLGCVKSATAPVTNGQRALPAPAAFGDFSPVKSHPPGGYGTKVKNKLQLISKMKDLTFDLSFLSCIFRFFDTLSGASGNLPGAPLCFKNFLKSDG